MLKSLELFGFKSFADRTRFDFSPGITCVVGPNGSGKSNVVDALKWILGDQSAKSLRGKDMTDVIFNGAANRKASQFSEATLTFDNTGGMLAIDMPEVQIGRRLWRGGDSEYLINNAPARLKDVRDLFLGTGVGSAAYSIIEQGRVDQILQGHPSSRRAVFEEAAGVSRFKARKADAERKLERVSQNLVRLSDIVDELEAQLTSTRGQAAKAVKFKEVSDELRRWWVGLAADDYRHLRTEREDLLQVDHVDKQALDGLLERQRQLELRQAEFDSEIGEVDDALDRYEKRAAQIRESAARHEATVRFQSSRHQELVAELQRLSRQAVQFRHRLQCGIGDQQSADDQLRNAEEEAERQLRTLHENEERQQQAQTEAQQAKQRAAEIRDRQLSLTQDLSSRNGEAAALEQRIAEHARTREQLQQTLVDRQARGEELQAIAAAAKARQADAGERLEELKSRMSDVRSRRSELEDAKGRQSAQLNALREQLSAGQARKSVLEEFERRQEGLGIGVREILQRARTAVSPPWSDVLGSVADLLDVPLEHAALLEVALGDRAQLIVLRQPGAFLDYLNSGKCLISGRVGFVSQPEPDSFASSVASSADLSDEPGIQERADRLTSDEKAPGLARLLLGDTWIVESLEDALRIAAGLGRGCRFVTLQGETLEADGTLFVGSVRNETAVVSRKSELRSLKHDLQTMAEQSEAVAAELERRAAELAALDARLAEEDETLAEATRTYSEFATQSASAVRELQAALDSTVACEQECVRLEKLHETDETRLAETRRQCEALDEELKSLQAEMQTADKAAEDRQDRIQDAERARSTAQAELAKLRERVESLRHQRRQLESDASGASEQLDELNRRIDATRQRDRQARLLTLNASAEFSEMCYEAEAVLAASLEWRLKKAGMRQERGRLTVEEQSFRKQRREVESRRHTRDMRLREIDHQLATLAERIDDEYQFTLEDIAKSGESALKLLAEEVRQRRGGPASADDDAAAEPDPDRADESSMTQDVESDGASDVVSGAEADATADAVSEQSPTTIEPAELAADDESSTDDEIVFAEVRDELEQRVARLRRKLKAMGSVNADSLRDLEELEQRYRHMHGQLEDLEEAKATLEDIIRRINSESRRMFHETFETVRGNFQDLFRKIFGGGEADILLEDPDDALECGIDISARPPGKELRNLSLLSGGEKTMTAIALVMAIFRSKPSPFCILDEVDAALDEANVERFSNVLKEFRESTQFIMISHHKRTMSSADVLYGVTMEQSGVSKRMSVRFEDVAEDGNIVSSAAA